jgi:hypothetical protein
MATEVLLSIHAGRTEAYDVSITTWRFQGLDKMRACDGIIELVKFYEQYKSLFTIQ